MADNKLLGAGGLYYGDNEISKAYMGNNLVWEKEIDYSKEYLTYVSLEDDNEIKYVVYGNITERIIEVSTDNGKTWTSFGPTKNPGTLLATLNKNQKIQIRGNNAYYGSDNWKCQWIEATKKVNVYGNIMSLFNSTSFTTLYTISYSYALCRWFRNAKIINASNLILPATTLSDHCYANLFDQDRLMEVGPTILPATRLSNYCYYMMFYGCSSLTTAPELPATTLVSNCYYYMFYNCSKLNYIKAMFTTTPSTTYTSNWVNGVSATGTFVKNSSATWNVSGANGIPSGWTVQTASS